MNRASEPPARQDRYSWAAVHFQKGSRQPESSLRGRPRDGADCLRSPRFPMYRRRLDGVQNLVQPRQFRIHGFAFRQRHDGTHVRQEVVTVMKVPDIGGQHLANPRWVATGVVCERVIRAIEIDTQLAEERPIGIIHRTFPPSRCRQFPSLRAGADGPLGSRKRRNCGPRGESPHRCSRDAGEPGARV